MVILTGKQYQHWAPLAYIIHALITYTTRDQENT